MERDFFTLTEEEAKSRLDLVLKQRYPDHSRTYLQYLISHSSVTANGKPVKKGHKQKAGEEIELFFLHSPELTIAPEPIPLDIIYEDDHIIAINKPAGLVVHPAPGHPSGTLVNALLSHCQLSDSAEPLRPGIVHRLDKETSGVILCAKTTQAHKGLVEQFTNRQIEKTYLAITVGNPGAQTIDAPIGRHPSRRKEMTVLERGRSAVTHIETIEHSDRFALVKARPVTGRTHQIRVHLRHIKTPILGDSVYGSEKMNRECGVDRQLLHAHTITCTHPISGKQISFTAPDSYLSERWLQLI